MNKIKADKLEYLVHNFTYVDSLPFSFVCTEEYYSAKVLNEFHDVRPRRTYPGTFKDEYPSFLGCLDAFYWDSFIFYVPWWTKK